MWQREKLAILLHNTVVQYGTSLAECLLIWDSTQFQEGETIEKDYVVCQSESPNDEDLMFFELNLECSFFVCFDLGIWTWLSFITNALCCNPFFKTAKETKFQKSLFSKLIPFIWQLRIFKKMFQVQKWPCSLIRKEISWSSAFQVGSLFWKDTFNCVSASRFIFLNTTLQFQSTSVWVQPVVD